MEADEEEEERSRPWRKDSNSVILGQSGLFPGDTQNPSGEGRECAKRKKL